MNYTQTLNRPLGNNEVDFNLDSLAMRLKQAGADDMSVILRRDLPRPLTTREMDNNFQRLDLAAKKLLYGDGPYPSLDQQFAGATMLDPRVNYARPSAATYTDSSGRIRTAGVNEPRFTYDPITGEALGLLLESVATNLLPYSGDAIKAYPTSSYASFAETDILGPDGKTYASKLMVKSGVSWSAGGAYRDLWKAEEAKKYTFFVIIKKAEYSTVRVAITDNSSDASVVVNLTSGEITTTYGSMENIEGRVIRLRDGWCQVCVSATTGNLPLVRARMYAHGVGEGDGEAGFYVWATDLKEGGLSSYIPTEGSQVTRAADSFILPVGDWYRQDEGTLFFDGTALSQTPGSAGFIARLHGGGNRLIGVPHTPGESISRNGYVRNGGDYSFVGPPGGTVPFGTRVKAAISWSSFGFKVAFNGGVSVEADAPDGYPNVTSLLLGRSTAGIEDAGRSSLIRSVSYYPRRLTDAQLIALTELPA